MDINERREALRARVRKKLDGEEEIPEEDDDLVVQEHEITMSTTQNEDLVLIDDKNGLLTLASSLIFIGSVLGIITGLLLLQGNPTDLLGNTLEVDDVIDVRGIVLESESGDSMEGVTIELLEIGGNTVLQTASTNSYGYYEFENVAPEKHIIRVTLEGYKSVERTIVATNVNQDAFTMTTGEGTVIEDETISSTGWTLENAVALSTGIAHHNSGQLKEAERIYRDILKVANTHPIALTLLAKLSFTNGKYNEVKKILPIVLKHYPEYMKAHVLAGDYYSQVNEYDIAGKAYRRAILLYPSQAATIIALGNLIQSNSLQDDKLLSILLCLYRKASIIEPASIPALNNLAAIYLKLKEPYEALQTLDSVFEVDPHNIRSLAYKTVALMGADEQSKVDYLVGFLSLIHI